MYLIAMTSDEAEIQRNCSKLQLFSGYLLLRTFINLNDEPRLKTSSSSVIAVAPRKFVRGI